MCSDTQLLVIGSGPFEFRVIGAGQGVSPPHYRYIAD